MSPSPREALVGPTDPLELLSNHVDMRRTEKN